MTIEYLAGNRLKGTTAERPALGLPSGSVGGWVELARTTLGSTGNNIDVSSLPDKRYYMFLTHAPTDSSGYVLDRYRLNADTGSNYSMRSSLNGAGDGTGTSNSEGIIFSDGASIHQAGEIFTMGYIANLSGKEKLLIGHTMHNDTAGAGTAPDRGEGVGKHAQTSNPVTSVNCVNTNNTGFASGSEMVVLGWDPSDTHTTNFWEELASVDLSGGASSSLDSGTISAKKYLWVQILMEQTADSNYPLRFNSDSGSNYAYRYRTDGGTEFPHTSQTGMNLRSSTANLPVFVNMFIVNNSAQEKLIIEHDVKSNTAGAGNAPLRTEQAGKWANTSAQITSIQLHSGSGNLNTNTIMKVWGSD